MYNRYIPQPDGSYRRSRHQDQVPKGPPSPPAMPKPPEPEGGCSPAPPPPPPRREPVCKGPQDPGNFLKNLLPKDFETGDLIIVLLLLLMAGDSEEGRANALLTLALYFIM